ncbi:alpha/beta fold hydrolase [Nocardioides stalactiti]|uniref:alpha/beta fold hydrolase n=1 Tax=Nocardioides stalactiti TaxID=2755356 RepID=UPI0016024EB3|nr:alpha/beta fold hydrolase [Nocardioides stalactiti]
MQQQPPGRDATDHVLLLHGMGCGPWVWDSVEEHLPAHLVAVAVTIAGHRGGTPLAAAADRRASEQMLDDIEAALDQRGIARLHVVGNSLGGWLALRLAERGRALSVLCLAPAGGWQPGSVFERLLISRFALGQQAARALARRPALLGSPRLRHAVLAPVVADPDKVPAADVERFVRDMADCQALRLALASPDARALARVDSLAAPTRIAWSGEDRVLSRRRARHGFDHLRADELELAGLGHLPMLDDPQAVARLIADAVARAESSRKVS